MTTDSIAQLLREAASELRANIEQQYGQSLEYPSYRRKYDAAMELPNSMDSAAASLVAQEPVAWACRSGSTIRPSTKMELKNGDADDRGQANDYNIPLYRYPPTIAVPEGWKLVPVEPTSHDWDEQDKCRRCGDRDWYAGPICTPKQPVEHQPDATQPVGRVTTIGGYPDESEHVVEWLCRYKDLKHGDYIYASPQPYTTKLAEAYGWHGIDSAPRDGRWIYGWRNHSVRPIQVRFDNQYGEFENDDGEHVYALTHWMPLPAAPQQGGGE